MRVRPIEATWIGADAYAATVSRAGACAATEGCAGVCARPP
ncbi:hypothetical protein ACWCPM_10380 [Streptomyces sp. NPDC002309]